MAFHNQCNASPAVVSATNKISIRKSENQANLAAKSQIIITTTTTSITTATHTQPDFNQIHSIVCLSSSNGRLSRVQDEKEDEDENENSKEGATTTQGLHIVVGVVANSKRIS